MIECLALGGGELANVVVEAGDRNAAILVNERSYQTSEHVGGVGNSTAEETRVEILIWANNLNLHIS